jgi:hypothetical protein
MSRQDGMKLAAWSSVAVVALIALSWAVLALMRDLPVLVPLMYGSEADAERMESAVATEVTWLASSAAARIEEAEALRMAQEGAMGLLKALEGDFQVASQQLEQLQRRLAQAGSDGGTMAETLLRAEEGRDALEQAQEELRVRFEKVPMAARQEVEDTEEVLERLRQAGESIWEASEKIGSLNVLGKNLLAQSERLGHLQGIVADYQEAMENAVDRTLLEELLLREDTLPKLGSALGFNLELDEEGVLTEEETVIDMVMRAVERLVDEVSAAALEQSECKSAESLLGTLDKELAVIAADGTGRVDFAAAPGGSIMAHTATWAPKGYSAMQRAADVLKGRRAAVGRPQEVISTHSGMGHCWAMEGSSGSVTVRLADHILIDSISLEHIPAVIAMDGGMAAPNHFRVWAYDHIAKPAPLWQRLPGKGGIPQDVEPLFLLEGVYDLDGPVVQTFQVPKGVVPGSAVELEVLSNHGHADYTCIYRLRVHGRMESEVE